jgi:hypothetical protein
MGIGEVLSSGFKRPSREADHSIPSRAEVKNYGAMPRYLIPLYGVALNELILAL